MAALATRPSATMYAAPAQFPRSDQAADGRVGCAHHLAESTVDFRLGPAQALEILRPFEVTDRDTARIGEDIRNDRDAAASGNVGAFAASTITLARSSRATS